MRILWITNIVFPSIAEQLGMPKVVVGGWMYSAAKSLIEEDPTLQLAVATVYPGDTFVDQELDGIRYFILPLKGASNLKYNKSLEKYWRDINDAFAPDCVHLHGTEYAHGLAFLRACPNVRSVASIQGLVSSIARYYLAGLTTWDIIKSLTLRDVVRGTIWGDKRSFERRGRLEVEIVNRLQHIIGRTSWDKAHVLAINPTIQYHFCNETLRPEFYGKTWTYEECEKHSIFVSQANYPIKGLHQLLKAMPLILRRYPDAKINVAGANAAKVKGLWQKVRQTGYGRYVAKLIKQYHLEDKVFFTGSLSAEQMCRRYLASNVFVSASAIENSPNSLGEAQLLGVPCVASYVGGTMDMMIGDEEHLYRFEEVEMLAEKVCDIFENCRTANISSQERAAIRHDGKRNSEELYSIYQLLVQ